MTKLLSPASSVSSASFNTSYERFQFYCIWNLPNSLVSMLSHYQVKRVPAEKLRELLNLESASSKATPRFLLAGNPPKPFPVAWRNASPHQLLRDSQSNRRGKTEIYYWISFRSYAADKVALISVDTSSIDTLTPAGELPRGIL